MFHTLTRQLCLGAAIILFGAPAWADYEAGQTAWKAGRHVEALTQWRGAARTGDSRAMLALGRAFAKGLGVPQDYVLAHMWLNLAAGRGNADAAAEREALASKMTPQQIASAQDRARAWGSDSAAAASKAATALRKTASPPPPGPPPPRAIREAQTLLTALGYETGAADGKWGVRTGRAYAAFLRDAGLPSRKVLTPDALRAMRAAAKGKNVAAPAASADQKSAAKRKANLHRLVAAGDVDGVKAALKRGADPNARDAKGWTALIHAVDKGYKLLVPPLLAAKADPNARLADGATALFIAALHGHSEIIASLMKAGADPKIRGPKGRTAVDVARARYRDTGTSQTKATDPAVRALLDGKTWAQVEDDARATRELISNLGKKFRDCDECPEMVVVPAGSFRMGSPGDEEGRFDREGPVHGVTIARPFAVGRHEVTRGEFGRFVSATGRNMSGGCWGLTGKGWKYESGRSWRSPGFGQTERDPVVCVDWNDAKAYVKWLSAKTGKPYRLLSESEWEYAARAGSSTRYSWGDGIGRNRANCDGCGSRWDSERTSPVGSFAANGFGMHDMHGNVREWVEDCWNKSYDGAPKGGSAWLAGDCGERVRRGGSWLYEPRALRAAFRGRNLSENRSNGTGFRVARTLTP